MSPARVCHGSLHGAETSFQLTLALNRFTNVPTCSRYADCEHFMSALVPPALDKREITSDLRNLRNCSLCCCKYQQYLYAVEISYSESAYPIAT